MACINAVTRPAEALAQLGALGARDANAGHTHVSGNEHPGAWQASHHNPDGDFNVRPGHCCEEVPCVHGLVSSGALTG